MERENRRLDALVSLQQEINGLEFNLAAIFDLVAKRAHELCRADSATIEIVHHDELVVQAAVGLAVPYPNNHSKLDASLCGQAVLSGQVVYCEDVESNDRLRHFSSLQPGMRSVVAVPLPLANGEYGGVLSVLAKKIVAFDRGDVQVLQLLAGFAATALYQAQESQRTHDLTAELVRRDLLEAELQVALENEKNQYQNTSQFISLISHDFRTPLTAIQSSTELLQYYSDRFTSQKKTEIYERIHSSVRHLTELLDNVALVSKVRAGKLHFQPEPISPQDLCKSLISEIEPSGTSPARLGYTGPIENNYFLLDKNLIRLGLWHLLTNALKYSPADSPVELKLVTQSDAVVFSVTDYGDGILEQDQSRVFELFFRGSNVSTVRGSGMGLTIARDCAELHGGGIDFSREPGRGATFSVTIPSVQA